MRDGHEALTGKASRDVFDVLLQTPPFLDDDNTWPGSGTFGHNQVGRRTSAADFQSNKFT
jgi:hypothetical protein